MKFVHSLVRHVQMQDSLLTVHDDYVTLYLRYQEGWQQLAELGVTLYSNVQWSVVQWSVRH